MGVSFRCDREITAIGAASVTERDVFIAALGKATPADRLAYLDEACGGRTELRRRSKVLQRRGC